ncbi:LemA family protein [Uliginosibacterium gangwonense]|uniref:LemA family protein n=1 Tax=Uliginosibacterium gangwonense TaxID=392736 RepID=UPI0003750437|nr:LemA family protein [Uliginosibacterium gangwonense]
MKVFKRIALVGIVVAIVISGILINQLSQADSKVLTAWQSVTNTYAERNDAVQAVIVTAKAQPGFDANTIKALEQALSDARKQPPTTMLIQDSQAFDNFKQAQAMLTGAMYRVKAVAKASPALSQSSEITVMNNYLDGADKNNRLDEVRKKYSETVAQYNTLTSSFPSSIFATFLGYHPKPEFVHFAS